MNSILNRDFAKNQGFRLESRRPAAWAKGWLTIRWVVIGWIMLAGLWGTSHSQAQAPSTDRNFVRKETVRTPGIITDAQVLSLTVDQKQTTYQYSDGLGRPLQSVAVQGSPTRNDLVQPHYYDSRGLPSRSYLPYRIGTTNGAFRPAPLSEQSSFYTTPPAGVTADTRPYSETSYETSPLARPLSATPVGSAFAAKPVSAISKVNEANAVRQWTITGGLPRSTAFYPAGTLTIAENRDGENNLSRSYTDFAGRTVLKQVQATASTWLNTYYVYNDYNELIFVITPEAETNLTPDQAFADRWYFCYEYDQLGRQTGSKAPGAGWVYSIYDRWDRPVLTQDGVQRAKSPAEWSFVKYDHFNRAVLSGTLRTAAARSTLTTEVAAATGRFESRNTSAIGYSLNGSYPTTVTEADLLNISYYDDYAYLTNAGWDAEGKSFAFVAESGYTGVVLGTVKGQATGSKNRILGTNQWLHTVTYYDKFYRPLQTVSGHQRSGTVRTTSEYNFSSEVLKSLTVYTYAGGSQRITQRFTYDHTGRLLRAFHQINAEPEVLLSEMVYNELGQAITTRYHSRNNGSNWLCQNNKQYTVQGKLRRLAYNFSAGGNAIFTQELSYEQPLSSGNTPRFDGMISASRWQYAATDPEKAYHYGFDKAGRLTDAFYRQKNSGAPTWTSGTNFYNETGINYSPNGNITALTRTAERSGTAATIDQLAYSYDGNRLRSVSDNAPATHRPEGFKDGVALADEYVYDANGNLTADRNKGISTIAYNAIDRAERITFADNSYIQYTYLASGDLLAITYHNTAGAQTRKIDYVGELEFENNTLRHIAHGAGRALMVTSGNANYQYYLTDYLGSTRAVVQERTATYAVTATMEAAHTGEEGNQFLNYDKAVRVNADLFNHTQEADAHYALRLSGGTGKATGLARSVSVMPGDTVRMEVFGKYLDLNRQAANPALLAMMAAMPATSGLAAAGAESSLVAGATTGASQTPLSVLLTGKDNRGDAPPAYLNYLFFDKDMNYKYGGFVQMSKAALEDGTDVPHENLSSEVVVTEPGFLYIYLSNESTTPSEVFFDNFTVSVSESQLVQLIDYYPYGMVASQWERTGEQTTRDLFQGKTYEGLTALADFHARHYDAALGRWHAVDPANQFASPYTGMANNPIMSIDPDGRFVPLVIAAAAIIGAGINVASNWQAISSSPDIWTGIGRAAGFAAIGAASGWVSLYNPMAGAAINGVGNAILGGVINGQDASTIAVNAVVSGSISAVTAYGGAALGKAIAPTINSIVPKAIANSPVLSKAFTNTLGGAAVGSVIGGVMGGLTGQGIGRGALSGLGSGAATGLLSGVAQGFIQAKQTNVNPWTGKLFTPVGGTFENGNGFTAGYIDNNNRVHSTQSVTLDEGNQGKHIMTHHHYRAGKSAITVDPNTLINDLNSGNFTVVGTAPRNSFPIVKFNYTIGHVINNSNGVYMGPTQYGVVHYNSRGQAHIVPFWK